MKKDQTADLLTVFLLASNLAKKDGNTATAKKYLKVFKEIAAGINECKRYSITEIEEPEPEPKPNSFEARLFKYAEAGARERLESILKDIGTEQVKEYNQGPDQNSYLRFHQLINEYDQIAADLHCIDAAIKNSKK